MKMSLIFFVQAFAFVDTGDQILSESKDCFAHTITVDLYSFILLWNIPKTCTSIFNVSLAGVDHLIGNFDKERRHSFR